MLPLSLCDSAELGLGGKPGPTPARGQDGGWAGGAGWDPPLPPGPQLDVRSYMGENDTNLDPLG